MTDIALRQFLAVLLWFRLVLLQDAALLFGTHPELPMFHFKPFNTQHFRDYAGEAVQAVARAEVQARTAFHNLPEHLVCSLKGLVTSMTLDQQVQRTENEALRAEVRRHMEVQSALLAELQASSKGRRGKSHKSASAPSGKSSHARRITPRLKTRQATAALPPTCQAPNQLLPALPPLHLQAHAPHRPLATMPNVTINISAPGTARHLSTSTPTSADAHADLLLLAPPAARSEPVALDSGTDQLMTASILASHSDPRSEKWAALLAKHGREKLDAHEWEWRNGDWLPWYRYQPVDAITDVWTEYVDGLNGCLSTRELKDRWGRNGVAMKGA